ncbi:glycosyltransferase family 9 protein [Gramella sp. Hel_I_59]|uniref:glycosyltransferase family 9 protein n=1 Tax=Gramella sp. Hel_I_59 TaxID=1249978 RepID=UPI00325FC728
MKMIGDVLTSSILFEALRKEYPAAQLDYLIYKHTTPVVENNPFINNIIPFGRYQSYSGLARIIRSEKYNVVIDVLSNFKTSILTGISGAAVRISYDKVYTRRVSTHVFSRKMEAKTNAGEAIEKRLRLLSPLLDDIPLEIKPKIYLKNYEIEKAAETLTSQISGSKKIIMVGVLGSNREKTYPLPYLAKLLDHIVEITDADILFNYIPIQQSYIDLFYDLCKTRTQKNIYLNIYRQNLREFLSLTYHCDALIGNEGGAINMAKALNIPTFAIYTPMINKSNWNIYEDGKQNVSVHIEDYYPYIIKPKSKIDKRTNEALYNQLVPKLIFPKLTKFLKNL